MRCARRAFAYVHWFNNSCITKYVANRIVNGQLFEVWRFN